MCDPLLDNIEKACGKTYIKGLKANIFITSMPEVVSIPNPTTGTLKIATALTFRSAVTGPPAVAAGQWWKWDISKVDGTYKAEPTGDADNPTIKVTVEAFIYGIDADKSYVANQTLGHEFILVVPDNNSNNRLVGEVGRGATITITEQTNDKSGYKCLIEWEAGHYPYFYEATLPS